MRPGPVHWATNAVWAGGPDVGTTTKTPPTAGQVEEGYYGSMRPGPREWNYHRWAMAERVKGISSMRVRNIIEANFAIFAATGAIGGPVDCVYSEAGNICTIINADNVSGGAPLFEVWESFNNTPSATGGMFYTAAVVPAAPPTTASPRIAQKAAATYDRGVATGAVGDVPRQSVGGGAWGAWGGPSPAGSYAVIQHSDIGGVWIAGGQIGVDEILVASSVAVAFAAPAVAAPAFAAAVTCLCASNHAAADVYPDDPGNDVILALSATEQSRSSGVCSSWTAPAAHGIGIAPLDLAYCKASGRFIACTQTGYAVSDDNGVTWTHHLLQGAASHARIACDGFGEWVIHQIQSPDRRIWASHDDGDSWDEVFSAVHIVAATDVAACYGGGRFHLPMQKENAAGGTAYAEVSLRGGE